MDDPYTYQQDYITSRLSEYYHDIMKAPNQKAGVTYAMFDIAKDYLKSITKVNTGKLVLIGGIQINMQHPCEDFFNPMLFEIHEVGKPVKDVLQEYMEERNYNN